MPGAARIQGHAQRDFGGGAHVAELSGSKVYRGRARAGHPVTCPHLVGPWASRMSLAGSLFALPVHEGG